MAPFLLPGSSPLNKTVNVTAPTRVRPFEQWKDFLFRISLGWVQWLKPVILAMAGSI
jgi:hypothetical protein